MLTATMFSHGVPVPSSCLEENLHLSDSDSEAKVDLKVKVSCCALTDKILVERYEKLAILRAHWLHVETDREMRAPKIQNVLVPANKQ